MLVDIDVDNVEFEVDGADVGVDVGVVERKGLTNEAMSLQLNSYSA